MALDNLENRATWKSNELLMHLIKNYIDTTNGLKVDATLEAGDIQIGAVEIKDHDSTNRADVADDGTGQIGLTVKINAQALPTGASTSANQITGNSSLSNIDTNTQSKALTIVSSDATPIAAAANTQIIAAPGAGSHIRVYYIETVNSGATTTKVSWRAGAAGALRYHSSLAQNGIFAHNINKGHIEYWDLGDNIALYLNTDAAGSIDYTVEYEVV